MLHNNLASVYSEYSVIFISVSRFMHDYEDERHHELTPFSPALRSGQFLFQEPPAKSKFLAIKANF